MQGDAGRGHKGTGMWGRVGKAGAGRGHLPPWPDPSWCVRGWLGSGQSGRRHSPLRGRSTPGLSSTAAPALLTGQSRCCHHHRHWGWRSGRTCEILTGAQTFDVEIC